MCCIQESHDFESMSNYGRQSHTIFRYVNFGRSCDFVEQTIQCIKVIFVCTQDGPKFVTTFSQKGGVYTTPIRGTM